MNRRARAAALAAAGVAVGLMSSSGPGRRLDTGLFRAANRARGRAADLVFEGVTELGSIWGSLGTALALSAAGRGGVARRAFAAAGTTWALGQVLKRVFGRPRPYDAFAEHTRLLIAKPRGTSWPSSHLMVLMAVLTVAERELELGPVASAAVLGLAGLVGTSRSYLGVHYPSDVLGGLLLGRAVGLAWPSGRSIDR